MNVRDPSRQVDTAMMTWRLRPAGLRPASCRNRLLSQVRRHPGRGHGDAPDAGV